MDYNPPIIAQTKAQQGYYFTPNVGPYDVWAIQYGYGPITAADSEGELPALRQIASRSAEPQLAYATDEDATDAGGATAVDPLVLPYDYSSDPVEFARRRMELAKTLLAKLEATGPGDGQSYEEFRRRFNRITGEYNAGFNLSRWVGGSYFRRNHAGDPGEKTPVEPIPAAQQRKALNVIRKYLLAEDAFRFRPDTLNKLAPSRWSHWGQSAFAGGTTDYPLLERIEGFQWGAIARIYNPATMRRILNTEMRVANPKDALTLTEVFGGITDSLWSEALAGPRDINPARRNIQRDHLDLMVDLALHPGAAPTDAQSLARRELIRLQAAIRRSLAPVPSGPTTLAVNKALRVGITAGKPGVKAPAPVALDAVTRAHLEECDARISQALSASMLTQ
jgi:hypothetical protein